MDMDESKRIDRVALACVQCRSRHVKCDATQPTCNRCKRDRKECTYQKSRRGGLDKAALARRRLRLQQEAERAIQNNRDSSNNPPSNQSQDSSTESSQDGEPSEQIDRISPPMLNIDAIQIAADPLATSNNVSFQVSTDRLVEIYYESFWPSFPITLPLHFLNARKCNDNHGMHDLFLVLHWIGSLFAPWTPSEPYYKAAFQALCAPTLPRTPFTVQALMLFAIAQQNSDLRMEGRQSLDAAVNLALELCMNSQEFAQVYGEANPVLEESWRRTYYILYMTDLHFSVMVNKPLFTLLNVPNLVDLPCDDEFYETGQIPPAVTWKEYDNRELDDVQVIYSSIVYWYDICRVVTYIMKSFLETGKFSDTLINNVDAKVAAWQTLLPLCKKDPMRQNGKVDEVIFMAHMSASVVIMTTHRPFSSLTYGIEELSTESFNNPVPFIESLKPNRGAHTARALKAMEMQTKLLAIPCAIETHHVFAMCIAAELGTAQISACNQFFEDHALAIARDRVRLTIGFLNSMGSVWSLGKKMAREVRFIARRTLAGVETNVEEPNPSAEIDIPRDDLIWPIDPSMHIDIYAGITLPINWDASLFNYSSSNSSSIS